MHLVSRAVLQKWNALTDQERVLHVLSGRTTRYELPVMWLSRVAIQTALTTRRVGT
jgi:hypothetical protein